MNVTKKILCLLLFAAVLVAAAACNRGNGETTTKPAGESSTTLPAGEVTTSPGFEFTTDPAGATDVTETTTFLSDTELPTGSKVEVTTDAQGLPTDSKVETILGSLIKGEKYTMKFTLQTEMDGEKMVLPVTTYVSGKKTVMDTEMDTSAMGMPGLKTMKVRFLSTGTDFYAILPAYKMYYKMDSGDFGDIFSANLGKGTEDSTYLGTYKVKFDGKEYICEEYTADGVLMKYYFLGGELKRIEVTETSSTPYTTSIMDIASISQDVDESVFKVPTGYMDLSAFGGLN